MPKKRIKRPMVSLRLDPSDVKRLQDITDASRLTRSQIMRAALQYFFDNSARALRDFVSTKTSPANGA